MHDSLDTIAKNIIYTGVAGTGKTYQLLQIAKTYTDYLAVINSDELRTQLLHDLSWREVVCLIFLDLHTEQQDLVKVPEIMAHNFFIAKADQNERDKNLNNTLWAVLGTHSPINSQTVTYKKRASQAYFDKDDSGAWYLLAESMPLLIELSQQLAEFKEALAHSVMSNKQNFSQQRFSMVSFHQAYGYEEFVEGIRPVISSAGQVNQSGQGNQSGQSNNSQMYYDIQAGAFLKLCQRAAADPEQRYAMLIDEINRANVSRVFGELLSLIEPDKRAGLPNAMQVNLAYSGRTFSVPTNVDIYATMNTQDHSLAPLDMALRRRFRFIDCPPRPELLPIINIVNHSVSDNKEEQLSAAMIDLAQLLSGLNNRIIQTLGQEAQLGHAFLFSVNDLGQLQTALIEQIIPQLAQATGGQLSLLQYLFNDEQQPFSAQFINDAQAVSKQSRPANEQANASSQGQIFGGQSAFLGQTMSGGGYVINPNLLARTGEFSQPSVYQRLY